MKKIACLFLLLSCTYASAQVTQSQVQTMINTNINANGHGAITGPVLNSVLSNMNTAIFQPFVLGVADVRQFGIGSCGGSTNATSAIAAAYAAGYNSVFMPAGCFMQGTGAYTSISANLNIICGNTSAANPTAIIKAVDRTNAGVPGFIYIDAGASLLNCATQSYPGDQLASPATTQKTVFQPIVTNISNAQSTWVPQVGAQLINIGPNIVSPGGVISTDNPGIQITGASSGDNIYSATAGTGTNLRMETNGSGDSGLLFFNGDGAPANTHYGLHILEYSQGVGSFSIKIDQQPGATADAIKSTGFLVDVSGNVTGLSYKVGSTAGVDCPSGVNATTVTVAKGIVTHC